MGAGASFPGDGVQLTDIEIDSIYESVAGVVKEKVGDKIGEEGAFIQVVEKKFNLPPGAFQGLLASAVPKSPREEAVPPEAPSMALVEPRLSIVELKEALSKSGIFAPAEGMSEEDLSSQIGSLFDEIETILGNKPTYVVKEEDAKHVDWKALEMLGDENLMQKEKETPKIDAAHSGSDHSNKALQKLGTIKAVDSKKVRARLGSDMSTNQMKQQQLAEARERKKKKDKGMLGGMMGHKHEEGE